MKILWILVVLQTARAQPGFGNSYLRSSGLCHKWSCVNTKLHFSDSLPTSEEFTNVLRGLLPAGDWQNVVDKVINTCYNNRPRRYSNTCPGQAVLHCAVDQLIENCPEASLRKDDACAPVNSLAGFNNMFTQSRYENFEDNLAYERRPSWFMRNYFSTKCCNLPELFNTTVLSECGFTSMIQFYVHNFQPKSQVDLPSQKPDTSSTTPLNNGDTVQVVKFSDIQDGSTQTITDPLDCCDISDFIQPSWRKECNFELNWKAQNRLVIKNCSSETTTAVPPTTTTSSALIRNDITIVPQSCEKETCVFNKLNILSSSGTVDVDAFTRLLDSFTNNHPTWNSAKGRVVTTCLRRPLTEYDAKCEINKILACTFDVLTENCPFANSSDPCKHSTSQRSTCQISSSKYRPKHRREICVLPELVERSVLTECGITSVSQMIPMTSVVKPKNYRLFSSTNKCVDLTPSTTCLMAKMGILNKYGFMDYFKIKDRIRHYSSQNGFEWSSSENVYMSGFTNGPLYSEYCNSPRKLLNVIDSMLLTCPQSKRKNTAQCATIFNDIHNTPVNVRNVSQEFQQRILNHFNHVFFPLQSYQAIQPRHIMKIKKTPLYNFGILNSNLAPKVSTIAIKPMITQKTVKPPLILLPVYMRVPQSNLLIRRPFVENGVMRSGFSLHNQIARAHISTPTPSTTAFVPSTPTSPTSISSSAPFQFSTPYNFTTTTTRQPISPTFPTDYESKFEMIKPE